MELNNSQLRLKRVLKQLLMNEEQTYSYELIADKATALNQSGLVNEALNDEEILDIVAALTAELSVTFTPSGTVVDPDTFTPWLQSRKPSTSTPRWDSYKQLLITRDWEEPVIRNLEQQTDEIVELLGDPEKPGEWCRKGLLMGEVQSGKTANYIGVLNKALDYGYKVLIVIGGHTNDLRRQTQARIDSDLLGIDSEFVDDNIARGSIKKVGIGKIDGTLNANLMTTVRGDFNSQRRTAGVTWLDSGLPTVFVIKKNAKLIDNVARYIRTQASQGQINLPLIVIDDEADWGTPNTGSDTDPTRVNESIRSLLDVSKKSSYVGITATPFANIFINDEAENETNGKDLFPSDYIRVLPAPSTYFGINQFFLPHHGGIRLDVEDCLYLIPIKHKSDHLVSELPGSLKSAIATYLIGVAIRNSRENKRKASSMLINVSRFNAVQEKIYLLVDEYLSLLQNCVATEFLRPNSVKSDLYNDLYETWSREFRGVSGSTWELVVENLTSSVGDFRTELVNSKTAKNRATARNLMSEAQRNSEDLRPTIYVGGDVLARGLTLEGLQVSYFVREPRTMDTLMQMGRWFGYRPGYSDLVRVWLPEDTAEDFAWSAEVTEELRMMLIEMRSRELTPKNFGLRVRTHPEGFRIVAANKSRSTVQIVEGSVIWENKVKESWNLSSKTEDRSRNFVAVKELLAELISPTAQETISATTSRSKYSIWNEVPLENIQRFFTKFVGHKSDDFGRAVPSRQSNIYEALSEAKGSEKWTVALVNGEQKSLILGDTGLEIKPSKRNSLKYFSKDDLIKASNRRILSSMSLVNSIPDSWGIKPDSQASALSQIANPILMIVSLSVDGNRIFAADAPDEEPVIVDSESPLIAVAIAFPKMDPIEAIWAAENAKKYTGNSVYLRILYSDSYETDEVEEEVE